MQDNTKTLELVVERLMNEEVDINGVYGVTPLIWTVKNGYLDILRREEVFFLSAWPLLLYHGKIMEEEGRSNSIISLRVPIRVQFFLFAS